MSVRVTPEQFAAVGRLAAGLPHPIDRLTWEVGLRRILGPAAVDRLVKERGRVPFSLDLIVDRGAIR